MRYRFLVLALAVLPRVAAAADCGTYSLYSLNNFPTYAAGAMDANLVGNPVGCQHAWTATSDSPAWLTVSPTSGNTGMFLHVSWTLNTGGARTGHVTVVGQGFTPPMVLNVNQSAFSGTLCTSYTVSPASASASGAAGSQVVTLTGVPSGCTGGSWTTASATPWLAASPLSGSAPGTTTVSWTQNTGAARTGSVTIAGTPFVVTQAAASACAPDATSLCLFGGRFRVTAQYTDYGGGHGAGTAVPLTSDTGYFWFFSSANVEAVLKMVSFCSGGGGMAVYATGLTDLGVVFTVTDTANGSTRSYSNPLGTGFKLVQDAPFVCLSRPQLPGEDGDPLLLADLGDRAIPAATTASYGQVEPLATCTADATSLCLYGGRFRVTATYKDYSANTGPGKAVALTSDTGYFWFFNSANVETVIKIINFCGPGSNAFAVYANGLTDVQVTLVVTDTQTGRTATYQNALGHPFELIRDAPFPCP